MDVRRLDVPEDSVHEIYAKNVIEYMELADAVAALEQWGKLVKKGGVLIIQTISFELLMDFYRNSKLSISHLTSLIFSGALLAKESPAMLSEDAAAREFCKSIYTEDLLVDVLVKNSFEIQSIYHDDSEQAYDATISENKNYYSNLRIRAIKI